MNNSIVHCYHGSSNIFDEFNFSQNGQHGGNIGAGCGLYFSTSKADAATYGNNIYECVLRLKTVISNHEVTLKPFDVSRICKETGNCISTPNAFALMIGCQSDTDIIVKLVEYFDLTVEEITNALSECGYTHTEDKITPEDPDMPHFIVYDLNTITINNVISIGII